jgi:putative ABC transport system ATP-binding protein
MQHMLTAKGVERAFPAAGGGEFLALKNIDLDAPAGRLTILKGRSGSGKTTLLNILSALDEPTRGSVWLDGREVTKMGEDARARLRRTQVGYVFQSVALIPMMTALENVEFALRLVKYKGDRRARALECLKMVGLAQRAGHMPQEMSGGEQQRVAVARAIAHSPKVLFADEPTGALDTTTGLQVVKIFKDLCASEGITIVMTTHDTGLMDIGDAVYELEDGEMIHAETRE